MVTQEEIINIIRDAVAKEFGSDKIKKIESFGPYECEDLNVIIAVEGIDEEKDTLELWSNLRHKFNDMNLDVPFKIVRA
ncbi:MAG: hypothetical protein ACE5J3_10310 [Methanosarcinales archaeon]